MRYLRTAVRETSTASRKRKGRHYKTLAAMPSGSEEATGSEQATVLTVGGGEGSGDGGVGDGGVEKDAVFWIQGEGRGGEVRGGGVKERDEEEAAARGRRRRRRRVAVRGQAVATRNGAARRRGSRGVGGTRKGKKVEWIF
nr:unnamed protein product [Digitaria exilis]